jgi:hypothetical protein
VDWDFGQPPVRRPRRLARHWSSFCLFTERHGLIAFMVFVLLLIAMNAFLEHLGWIQPCTQNCDGG